MTSHTTTRYEVDLDVDPSLAASLETYMIEKHIPEILDSGCFESIHFDRESKRRYRTTYVANSSDDLDRYLTDHAEHFRSDFRAHFPEGIGPSRAVWVELGNWRRAGTAT